MKDYYPPIVTYTNIFGPIADAFSVNYLYYNRKVVIVLPVFSQRYKVVGQKYLNRLISRALCKMHLCPCRQQ